MVDTPPVTLQPAEVDLFYFVPVSHFAEYIRSGGWTPLTRDLRLSVFGRLPLVSLLGFTTLHFASVGLPRYPGKEADLLLWGLTFEITSELLLDTGLGGDMNRIPVKFASPDMNALAEVWAGIVGKRLEFHLGVVFVFAAATALRGAFLYGAYRLMSGVFI